MYLKGEWSGSRKNATSLPTWQYQDALVLGHSCQRTGLSVRDGTAFVCGTEVVASVTFVLLHVVQNDLLRRRIRMSDSKNCQKNQYQSKHNFSQGR